MILKDDAQGQVVLAKIASIDESGAHRDRVVTEVSGPQTHNLAEKCHQDRFRLYGQEPCCNYVVAPKLANCVRKFAHLLKLDAA